MIHKKQLFALFGCGLVSWTIVQGTIALLPVYAVELGADPASTGTFLSLAFLAVTLGTLAAGWLADKFQRRKALIILAGALNIPTTWLMGQATAFWQLAILTAFVWFFVGVGFTTVNILAGLSAGEAERGKIFGILAINTSLGALIGGFVSGPIVERWGYPIWFLVAALCWALQPAIGLLIQDKLVVRARRDEAMSSLPAQPGFGGAFYLLLLANVIAFAAGFVALLGRPLLMDRLGFDLAAISGAVAIGGAVTLPFPLMLGWLSDRLGRYWLIVLCFFAGAIGLALLAVSVSLWHFWAASIFLAGVGVSLGIGPALVTDLVPEESLGTALAWYGFAPSMGGIIGFMLTGYAIEIFGMSTTFVAGAACTLIAIALVVQVRRARQLALA
jgi:MFS family permease